ncbi:tetratricopeptide repeat protein [Psychroflexus halocasei]|uniref:Tetratricopeptide repeat-containing protein n=1 Tax=Psychroflexus halocasei TaxID=908615 RepID=A0A1H3VWB4_9FLAO|nr:tetratricopeptide repeat protein [Psychroflexus halocasei]SDZ79097.1 Tetratricopeptide repeat-containing protein [Psychroflexus halocasei]
MKKIRYISFLFFFIASLTLFAQEEINQNEVNRDDLGDVSDQFQELFFEALAQEAIENPEKAISALEKCLKLDETNFAALFLLGKNHGKLEEYSKAESYLNKALGQAEADQKKYVHQVLYQLYTQNKTFEKAIEQALILSENNSNYQQELINLYHITKQYDKALNQLQEFDQRYGYSDSRDQQRYVIYRSQNDEKAAISYFQNRLKKNSKDKNAYRFLNRIYLNRNEFEKVIELSQKAQQNLPEFVDVLPSLSLAYIKTEQKDLAKKYAQKTLNNPMIAEKEKVEVINAYRIYAEQNAEIKQDLISLLDQAITSEKNTSSQKELGNFYKEKDQEKALGHYREALRNKPNDFKLYKEILNLELYLGKFEDALNTSEQALSVYPSQAIFYYTQAAALFELNQTQKSIDQLEMSLSLLIDNTQLELQIYELYLKIYQTEKNAEKTKLYQEKIKHLKE